MKRRELIRHLESHGCRELCEGGRQPVYWNPTTAKVSTIPRHNEVNDFLARKICRDLEIPAPR
ncbi:MAG TPA: type II toxin-antitoxin system HicA family toxin [Terriglobia bacterium]|nr:type II toxin-antitoxin system HicA family toxin [Terriglobia bacterium]